MAVLRLDETRNATNGQVTKTAWNDDGTVTTTVGAGQPSTRQQTPNEAAALAAWVAGNTADTNKKSIEQQAEDAITTNQTFRALGSPTNAQVLAQVRVLSLQNIKIIRYVFGHLDDDE